MFSCYVHMSSHLYSGVDSIFLQRRCTFCSACIGPRFRVLQELAYVGFQEDHWGCSEASRGTSYCYVTHSALIVSRYFQSDIMSTLFSQHLHLCDPGNSLRSRPPQLSFFPQYHISTNLLNIPSSYMWRYFHTATQTTLKSPQYGSVASHFCTQRT